jgi:hydroxypyruvate isomerase
MSHLQNPTSVSVNRRQWLHLASGAAAGACALAATDPVRAEKAVTKGRIKQSIVQWCFADEWDMEQLCQIAVGLGCQSIELVGP